MKYFDDLLLRMYLKDLKIILKRGYISKTLFNLVKKMRFSINTSAKSILYTIKGSLKHFVTYKLVLLINKLSLILTAGAN